MRTDPFPRERVYGERVRMWKVPQKMKKKNEKKRFARAKWSKIRIAVDLFNARNKNIQTLWVRIHMV